MKVKPRSVVTSPGGKQSRLGLIVMIGSLSAFGPLSIDMYLPGLPSLSDDLGGAAWQVQLTLTACLLGLAGGQFIAGPLSDATGRRRPLLVGLIAYTVSSLLCAMSPTVPVLIGLRLVQGMSGAAGVVIGRAMVRDLYSGSAAARFFAMTMAINGLAPILAPIIGGQMLNFTTWRGIFILLAIIGFTLFIAAWLTVKETLPPERRRTGGIRATLGVFGKLLGDSRFLGYTLTIGLMSGAMFSYIAGSPFVLENIYGLSPQVFSLVFATNAIGFVITSQISGRLVDRVNPRVLVATGLTIALTGGVWLIVVVLTGVGLIGLLIGFFMVISTIGLISPNSTALAMADHPGVAGSASALIGVIQFIIGSSATPLVSLGGSQTALPLTLIITLLITASMLAFIFLTRRTTTA